MRRAEKSGRKTRMTYDTFHRRASPHPLLRGGFPVVPRLRAHFHPGGDDVEKYAEEEKRRRARGVDHGDAGFGRSYSAARSASSDSFSRCTAKANPTRARCSVKPAYGACSRRRPLRVRNASMDPIFKNGSPRRETRARFSKRRSCGVVARAPRRIEQRRLVAHAPQGSDAPSTAR